MLHAFAMFFTVPSLGGSKLYDNNKYGIIGQSGSDYSDCEEV